MRKVLPVALAVLALMAPHVTRTQTDDAAAKNAAQARAALNAMVQALGGQAWLNMQNMEREGHVAGFFQGNPDPAQWSTLNFTSGPITTASSLPAIATWWSFTLAGRVLR